MGLIRCPASFQRLIEKLIYKIKNVIVYIDDQLVHSQSHEQHLQSLEAVIHRLEENNMLINLSHFYCGNTEVNYLGFRLTLTGIKPGKDTIKTMEMTKIP
jgi:hypothetical protein